MTALMSTQVSVNLSLNIIVRDDNGLHFAVMPLLSLTWLIMAIWRCGLIVNKFKFNLSRLADDIIYKVAIASKIFAVGFNSITWGIGL